MCLHIFVVIFNGYDLLLNKKILHVILMYSVYLKKTTYYTNVFLIFPMKKMILNIRFLVGSFILTSIRPHDIVDGLNTLIA